MRLNQFILHYLFAVFLFCFGTFDLAAQSANQKVEETLLLLSQTSKIPELGPVKIEPIEAPGLAVAEDRHGFMWFGGNDGLYRYDGDEYIHYQHDPYDSTSLSVNWVESLYVGSDDKIWIGTFGGGLNRFDPETNTFTHFFHEAGKPTSLSQDTVTVVLEDSRGTVWVGTHGGLNRFDKTTETFTRYLHDPGDPNSLSNNQIRALYEDSGGTIWVGTGSPIQSETPIGEGGLNRFHPESEKFTQYLHNPDDSTSLINNKIMSIYEDSRGTFWVGTLDNGLHTMNRKTGTFNRHLFDPYNLNNNSQPFLEGTPSVSDNCDGFGCGGVAFIHEDHQGLFWIGGMVGGLVRYDPETGATSHHDADNSGLRSDGIWSVHESNDGTLWVGAFSGMYRVFASANSFPLITRGLESFVSSLQEDSDHRIWIKDWWALERLDRMTGIFSHYQPNVAGTTKDSGGDLWIVYSAGGISRYSHQEDYFKHYFKDPVSVNKLYNSVSICADGNMQLWVGTYGSGLYHLDPLSETIINNYKKIPNEPNSLSDNSVWAIYEGRDGMLWIGTQNGLNLINLQQKNIPEQHDIRRFLKGKIITSILEDTENRLWVGTWGNGFYLLDPTTGHNQNFNSSNGLPSDKVAAILEDDDGFLWLSTSEGQAILPNSGKISRFDIKAESFTNFSNMDGLPDIGFFRNTALKTHDGLLLFGGKGGFTFFDPSVIRDPAYRSPKISLTGFRIYNKEITPASGDVLKRPVYLEDSIELSYLQNDFTFDYTAFDYRTPDQIHFQYQLEPYDLDWVSARSQRSARYSRIPPGEYQFRVRTMDNRGVYSVEEATMNILILPPWWRTWWAYGLYVLLFIASIFAMDRFQSKRLISKERDRAQKRELEKEKTHNRQLEEAYSELEDSLKKLTAAQDQLIQQEKLASLGQLTAGIAHEIKNPLNFVNNFSEVSLELVEEAIDELAKVKPKIDAAQLETIDETEFILKDIKSNLNKIHEHGSRANGIVSSMLQHSRGGSGKKEPTDLNALIKEYVNLAFHGMRAGRHPINVDIQLELDEKIGSVNLIGEDFSRVVLNIVNNAFDAMREKAKMVPDFTPQLIVRSRQSANAVDINFTDNGPGIPNDIKDKILQPFFTTKKGTEGTGLGLSITNDIVKAHGGEFRLESKTGDKTVFIIKIPIV